MSRRTLAPWWPAAWLLTSVALVAGLSRIESGWFLAALYVGLNACAVVSVTLDEKPISDRQLPIVGWCAAGQLPVMLWLLVNGRREREQLHETHGAKPPRS